MTEQHWQTIADRDRGDDPTWFHIAVGDRYTAERFEDRNVVVRIERPVPTTDEPSAQVTPSTEQVRSHFVFNQIDRVDAKLSAAAFDRWLAAMAPQPPTREQIAAVYAAIDDLVIDQGDAIAAEGVWAIRSAVDALLQRGGE